MGADRGRFSQAGKYGPGQSVYRQGDGIGGNNYYTGYGIRVTRLSIHGGLQEEAKKYAKLAVAYRGHHTRELLSRLIGELVAARHFEVAKDVLRYYPSAEDRMSAEKHLAHSLAQQGQFDEAIKMAKAIKDEADSAGSRVLVALVFQQVFGEAKLLQIEPQIAQTFTDSDSRQHFALFAKPCFFRAKPVGC